MNRLLLLAAGMTLVGNAYAAVPSPTPGPGPGPGPSATPPARPNTGPASYELALVDMQGQKKVLGALPASVFSPRISPDGKQVAFELADDAIVKSQPDNRRLFVAEMDKLDKRRALQVTPTTTRNLAPVWSDDGEYIVFLASGNGNDALYWERADGSTQPLYLLDGRAPEGLYKGRQLVFITRKGEHDYGISLLNMGTRKVSVLVDLPGSAQHSSRISPDGRWLAYASDETGRQEVWLEPLPVTGKRFQLTKQGGRHPVWSPDGRTLYFDQDGKVLRMDVALGVETPTAGIPAALPISGFQQGELRRQFDITPDGKALLMLFPVAGAP